MGQEVGPNRAPKWALEVGPDIPWEWALQNHKRLEEGTAKSLEDSCPLFRAESYEKAP